MSAAAMSSAGIGSRRQAFGLSAPLRYAFSATRARIRSLMWCSRR